MDLLEKTPTILDIVLKQPKLQPFLTSVNIILIDPTVELILESANVAELRSITRTILARFFKKEETLEEKVLAIGELHDNAVESKSTVGCQQNCYLVIVFLLDKYYHFLYTIIADKICRPVPEYVCLNKNDSRSMPDIWSERGRGTPLVSQFSDFFLRWHDQNHGLNISMVGFQLPKKNKKLSDKKEIPKERRRPPCRSRSGKATGG